MVECILRCKTTPGIIHHGAARLANRQQLRRREQRMTGVHLPDFGLDEIKDSLCEEAVPTATLALTQHFSSSEQPAVFTEQRRKKRL